MARTSAPPFTRRARPERAPNANPSAIPGTPKPQPPTTPAENAALDQDVWEPITGEEMSDTLTGIFEGAAEGFGPEWELKPDRAKKMGERWARVLNRFAKRARNPFVLRLLVYLAIGFACIELGAVIASRVVTSIRRARAEKLEKKRLVVVGQVHREQQPATGGGGAP